MSLETPIVLPENQTPPPEAQVIEQIYSVPLERPFGRELFNVMASLLGHVLHINRLNQPGSAAHE
jgi:hypothetical protein